MTSGVDREASCATIRGDTVKAGSDTPAYPFAFPVQTRDRNEGAFVHAGRDTTTATSRRFDGHDENERPTAGGGGGGGGGGGWPAVLERFASRFAFRFGFVRFPSRGALRIRRDLRRSSHAIGPTDPLPLTLGPSMLLRHSEFRQRSFEETSEMEDAFPSGARLSHLRLSLSTKLSLHSSNLIS